jgi:hypothetical protein
MTTTPPTPADVDEFVAAGGGAQLFDMFGVQSASQLYLETDALLWVLAYTDNAGSPHYEGLGVMPSGVVGASDTQLEAGSPPVADGGGPYFNSGSINLPNPAIGSAPNNFMALPYLRWLADSYGSITLRGYFLPAPPLPSPASDAVQAWVNDTSNWPTAG